MAHPRRRTEPRRRKRPDAAMSDHAPCSEENGVPQEDLLERVLSESNLNAAWKRVRANKGSPGIDGMSVGDFPAFAREQMPRLKDQIREGRYAPAAVRRVWIPKPNGEERPLGVPTVLDRVIQQALAQVLGPVFDADFSDRSYGFRTGRRAIDAVEHVSQCSQDGYGWGVECDLKSFFDVVNHDLLMRRVGLKIRDKRVLRLIGKYLRAGVRLEDGTTGKTPKGVPQGGPLSPLLANVMLDPLDRMIEGMGLPSVRYADDFLVMARSKSRALEAMVEIRRYVECELKLLVNDDKTRVSPLRECEFLGFNVAGKRIRASEKSLRRFKLRVKELTSRSLGVSMEFRLAKLKSYCVGWFHYFKQGFLHKEARAWDGWIRRRVRLCYWKMWKLSRTRRRMLISLGVEPSGVKLASRSRKGCWRLSMNPLVRYALSNAWLEKQGVPSLSKLLIAFRYGDQAKA